MNIFYRWGSLALAMWIATLLVPGIDVKGGFFTYFWVAFIFATLNAILGSILKLITAPISLLTFGLFIFVINASMLALTARWSDKLDVRDFWSALFASLIISFVTALLRGAKKAI